MDVEGVGLSVLRGLRDNIKNVKYIISVTILETIICCGWPYSPWGPCVKTFLTLLLRIILHNSSNEITKSENLSEILLIPLRDILSFFIRFISYTGNSVEWRNNTFSVDHLGLMHEKQVLNSQNISKTEKTSESLT